MRLSHFFIIVACLVFTTDCSTATTDSISNKYTGPTCIGEFCFDVESISQLMTEAELIQKFGKGYSKNGKFAFYCYEVPEQKLFVHFRPYHGEQRQIMDIFVSDVSNCPSADKSKTLFKPFVTREGLKLGDAAQKVFTIYGKPNATREGTGIERIGIDDETAIKSAPFGNTVLIYGGGHDGLVRSEIYLRDETISAIFISIY